MKQILVIIALCGSLFGAPAFTLENLKNLRIYIINKTNFIDEKHKALIEELAEKKVKSVGIELNKVDASTLMIKIESIIVDKTYVINVQIAVGEEVITRRKDKVGTLAFSYFMSDFMESKEPYKDTLESVNYLIDDFLELYLEDME